MLLVFLILAAQPLPIDACIKRPVGWTCKATWVASLPQRQQRAVLILLKGGLNLDIRDRLGPNIKTKKDACWAASVAGFGNAMLTMAATKNTDLRSYFGYSSEVYRRLVEGALSGEEAQTLMASRPMPGAIDAASKHDVAEVERLYKSNVEAAENALIAFAKVAASDIPQCK